MDLKTRKKIKNGAYSFLPGKELGEDDELDWGALSGISYPGKV